MATADVPAARGPILDMPSLGDAQRWVAVGSGLAVLRITETTGPRPGPALKLDYDFGEGRGFVVARCEIDVELPESWEACLSVRGNAPANGFEIKLVDAAGTSVWRWVSAAFAPPAAWTELHLLSHQFDFAWGPAGGGMPSRLSAVEFSVVAGPGGAGTLEVADLRLFELSLSMFSSVEASSAAPGSSAALVVDGDASTAWRSAPDEGPHSLTLLFAAKRDLGGVVIAWHQTARPRAFYIEVREPEGVWTSAYEVAEAGAAISFVPLSFVETWGVRVVAWSARRDEGVGIVSIILRPLAWSRTPSEFLINVAHASVRGSFPRYLLREQVLWTPVAAPDGGPIGLLNEDGAVEVGEAGFSLEPSLFVAEDEAVRWVTWADADRCVSLEAPPVPVATATWRFGDLDLQVTPFAEVSDSVHQVLVRYRLRNRAHREVRASILVGVRPLQVTPPWQNYRGLGGPSPIAAITIADGAVRIGEHGVLAASRPAAASGVTTFDAGGVARFLSRGIVPPQQQVSDPHARAEAVLRFDLLLDAGSTQELFVSCTPDRGAERTRRSGAVSAYDGESRLAAAVGAWRAALPLPPWQGPPGVVEAFASFTVAIAHVLACRDGAALHPGPRRYARAWIRDGAIMAAALLRAGRSDLSREFVQWYAPFQRDDGFVPSCVDRDGVDPLVEHDSHGQLIYAVAEVFRFTRDVGFARSLWPHCAKAAAYIELLRATRHKDAPGVPAVEACYGLLPESVSHEGYLAQPVHSYWDDFWALRGLRDAAMLARELGMAGEAEKWRAAAVDLSRAIETSMQLVMKERGLETVPASVEWADFDPTAIASAISLVGAGELFPADALARTFDKYLRGFRERKEGASSLSNYSAYEVRIVGALVRLGRRDDANELLDFLLADRRPPAWMQWPEITWRDRVAPGHLGDLPHCWIGAEFAFALRSMFVFERESDDALVIGAGLRSEWIDAPGGIAVRGLPTWYGTLDLAIERQAGGDYRIRVGGSARPPGGFVAALAAGSVSIEEIG